MTPTEHSHDGHATGALHYDRDTAELVPVVVCDCGAVLASFPRVPYAPNPTGLKG